MKICENVPCLFGKIKYCRLPLFNIGKIEQNLPLFKEYITEKLNIEFGHFYVKPPQPNSVLGRFIETIRFPNGFFKDFYSEELKENEKYEKPIKNIDLIETNSSKTSNKLEETNETIKNIDLKENIQNNLIKKIELGFGENGYYYDVQLCPLILTTRDFIIKIKEALKNLEHLEKKIENSLSEYYLKQIDENNVKEIQSISNFDITIENDISLLPFLFPNFAGYIETLENESELIVKGQCNKVQPLLRFQIYSEMMISDPNSYGRAEKYLERDRFFEIQQVINCEKKWRLFGRGIPVYKLINFINYFHNLN